jgi:hypothetical protein
MSSSLFYLCAIPGPIWGQPVNDYGIEISQFVADGLSCERRIAKGVNIDNEHRLYCLCCQRLEHEIVLSGRLWQINDISEFYAVLQKHLFPTQILGPGYLDLLTHTINQSGLARLGMTFFHPDQIRAHRIAFDQWTKWLGQGENLIVQQRLAFLDAAGKAGCGVIELQNGYHASTALDRERIVGDAFEVKRVEERGQFIEPPNFPTMDRTIGFFGSTGRKWQFVKTLREQIRKAIQTNEPLSLNNRFPSDVITETLNEFVFVPEGHQLRQLDLRLVYADGSEAKPFPLFCLPRLTGRVRLTSSSSPLKVALVSIRDMELDPEIDFYWFRNLDVTRRRALAEADQFCFDATLAQLTESMALGDVWIRLYHTGFVPAVLGFYRAVVHNLLISRTKQDTTIKVTPFYRGTSHFRAGTDWC